MGMTLDEAKAVLSANQLNVLMMACTGNLAQGCSRRSDYGGRASTLFSLRKRGLLNEMNTPTALGVALFERTRSAA